MIKKLLQFIRFLFIKQDVMEVYYIQGNDVFPKPLDKGEELAALIALGNGDEGARNALIEYNLRPVAYIVKYYETNPIFMENLISIGSIGLIKVVNTFKRDKNIRLVTCVSCCIENKVLMSLCKKSRREVEVGPDEPLSIDCGGDGLLFSDILRTGDDVVTKEFEKKGNKRKLLEAMSTLKEQECQILQMRYDVQYEELTQKDIAKHLGISQSYISRLEKRIIVKLKVRMKNSQ